MNTALMRLAGNDLKKALSFVQKIKEPAYMDFAAQSLAGYAAFFRAYASDYEAVVESCRALGATTGDFCIKGFAAGLVESGAPGKEYERAIAFCSFDGLSEKEKSACFERLMWYFYVIYPPDKFSEVCKLFQGEFVKSCSVY